MKKTFNFDYDMGEASAIFKVDTDLFTTEHAKAVLDFFLWDEGYEEDENCIDEVLKKYAMEAIQIATSHNYNDYGVTKEFQDKEGWIPLCKENGIELVYVDGYSFRESLLTLED